jgi:hypothetical protein
VAVGDSGKVATSSNATSWTQVFPSAGFGSSGIRAVSGQEEYYVAAGSGGKLATSVDTTSWTQRVSSFGLTNINGIYATDNLAIAVGNAGKIAFSG